MAEGDPQGAVERRVAARRLLQQPLVCAEHDPDTFRLLRRHEAELDRWFTQRLGYRLHLDADTARLFKTGYVPDRRPLRMATGRPLTQLEHTLLALALAATAAGPSVISLRDLIGEVRSCAVDADVTLTGDGLERRAIVNALRWMIELGLVTELHERVDAYADDAEADAVLRVRPDRIALLLVPSVAGGPDSAATVEAADRRAATRQWMRIRLVEDPVVYRHDLTDTEWTELRRRLGEEERLLDEMFGLVLEARAEGIAAVDPTNSLSDRPYPTGGGTLGYAALAVLERLAADRGGDDSEPARVDSAHLTPLLDELRTAAGKRWSKEYREHPERLVRRLLELMLDMRLVERDRLMPAAARYVIGADGGDGSDASDGSDGRQDALW